MNSSRSCHRGWDGALDEQNNLTPVTAKPDISQDYQPCLRDVQNYVWTLPVDLPKALILATGYHPVGASVITTTSVIRTNYPLCLPSLVVSAPAQLCFLLNYWIMFDIFYLVIVPADHVFPENAF